MERHVKMVSNDDHLKLKNGRKICWNFRKGRCRFGTSCQYAHDSDLSVDAITATAADVETAAPSFTAHSNKNNKRKRPGLCDAIEPGKRVLKAYQQQHQSTGPRRPFN